MQLIPCGCKENEAMYSVGQFSGGQLQSSTAKLCIAGAMLLINTR